MEPRGTWLRRAAIVLLVAFGATVALFGVLAALDAARAPKPRHEYFGTPLRNLAHRGGGANAPEATLPAFAAAAAAGADVLEMDVHLTADDALVVIHDASVDRTTGGSGRVAEMSLAALRALNAGDRFRAPGGGFPYRDAPIPVPTFAEVLEAHPDLPFVVEMKTAATAKPLCRAIRSAGRESRTLVGAFAQASLDRFRELCPEVATSASFAEVSRFSSFRPSGSPVSTSARRRRCSSARGAAASGGHAPLPAFRPPCRTAGDRVDRERPGGHDPALRSRRGRHPDRRPPRARRGSGRAPLMGRRAAPDRPGASPSRASPRAAPARRAAFAVLLRLEAAPGNRPPPRPDTLIARLEDSSGRAPLGRTGRWRANSSSECCAGGGPSTTPSTPTADARWRNSIRRCERRSGSGSTSCAIWTGCRRAPRCTSRSRWPPPRSGPARRDS